MENVYVIGVDFGSDSVRCVILNAKTGTEEATAVEYYPRWKEGKYCVPSKNQYRQHPLDYIESFEAVTKRALSECTAQIIDNVVGISFDTTCSTPVITDIEGTPLALLPQYKENHNAMFMLWKDHTSIEESDQINDLAHKWEIDYTAYEGGIYSCEWVWAKVLHALREDTAIRKDAYAWIEHCDWMGALLTGNAKPEAVIRSRCAAGHKAMWHESWGGLPSEAFLTTLDPLLSGMRDHLFTKTYTSDKSVGGLTSEWASKLGLKAGIAIGVGAIDCHIGAIGAGITPNVLVKTMGTSTCDIIMTDYQSIGERVIPGICGQVDGSVMAGYIGLEAGQSAFGDIYAWFKELMCWPLRNIAKSDAELESMIILALTAQAAEIDPSDSSLLAIDWLNGRRTPDADHRAKGAICGITLSTSAPAIFRALVEATAFGSRAITERLANEGVRIEGVIALGGIAKKSPFVMQILSDVIGLPILTVRSEQTCAVGAAMYAAVVAGVYKDIQTAQKAMGTGFETTTTPDAERHHIYNKMYERYLKFGQVAGTL